MFNTQSQPETTTDETTKKDTALVKIRAAEVALAAAQEAVAATVASGEIEPSVRLASPFAAAQAAMEDIRERVTKHDSETDSLRSQLAKAMVASLMS